MGVFVLGVAASLVAAVVFWFLVEYAAPLAWSRFRRGQGSIAGRWSTHDSAAPGAPRAGWADIKQAGKRVSITVKRERKRDGTDMASTRTFKYRGKFSSGNLAAIFEDASGDHARGTIVLHHKPGDNVLIGKTMYYDDQDNAGVYAHDFVLRRQVH